MNNIIVRPYIPGDSEKIYSLFDQYTPYERDAKFWVWINRLLSDENSLIIVGEHEGNIVGHYAIIPQNILVNGTNVKAAFAIHAFIHPDFRKGFLIMQITKKMYKIAKEHGIDFIYGFPNENFREIQVKADRWKEVHLFKALEKDSLRFQNTTLTLKEADDTYESIYNLSELLDAKTVTTNVQHQKSLNYYINRYLKHPQKIYQNFFVLDDKSIVAFLVLKTYHDGHNNIGHLIDYISMKNIKFKQLLTITENYFLSKVAKISVWKFSEDAKVALLENKYIESGFETFLGVKVLNQNKELESVLTDFKNWNLCMGDSDAF